MGIVHDCAEPLWRADCLETAVHGVEQRELAEHLVLLYAEHQGCAVNAQEVGHVEAAHEMHAYLCAVDVEQHAFDAFFQDASFVVCRAARGIGAHGGRRVLHHHAAVLVVGVGDGESVSTEMVEECLFRIAVVLKSLVVIEVVACEVCENAAGKLQAADAFLMNGVRATFHKGIFAASLGHFAQKTVQGDGVGRSVLRRHFAAVDIVAHGGAKAALVAEVAEEVIE